MPRKLRKSRTSGSCFIQGLSSQKNRFPAGFAERLYIVNNYVYNPPQTNQYTSPTVYAPGYNYLPTHGYTISPAPLPQGTQYGPAVNYQPLPTIAFQPVPSITYPTATSHNPHPPSPANLNVPQIQPGGSNRGSNPAPSNAGSNPRNIQSWVNGVDQGSNPSPMSVRSVSLHSGSASDRSGGYEHRDRKRGKKKSRSSTRTSSHRSASDDGSRAGGGSVWFTSQQG
jgi:hypothetical protein